MIFFIIENFDDEIQLKIGALSKFNYFENFL